MIRRLLLALLPAVLSLTVAPALSRCAAALLDCSNHVVAAAAVLGENQCQDESPGALSAAGCALGNAGRDCAHASEGLGRLSWEDAADSLSDASASFEAAGANFDGDLAHELDVAACALSDGASVSGCISLAAAAGPELAASGEALARAAGSLRAYSRDLAGGAMAARKEAADRLARASVALSSAGDAMREQGCLLEAGRPLDEAAG